MGQGLEHPVSIRLCQAIFSTSRPEYLVRTLHSQRLLDCTGFEVDRILFDDYPKGRDDKLIRGMAESYGYREVYLHAENLSIGGTWKEFWALIKGRGYDYIWQQEDDVEILAPVRLLDLAAVLNENPGASQLVLKRQPWYVGEVPAAALPTDTVSHGFRLEYNKGEYYFTPIASLYPANRIHFNYHEFYRTRYPQDEIFQRSNLNEALIGKALLEALGLRSLHVKSSAGHNLIQHIGEYTVGRKLLPHEPGFYAFSKVNPDVRCWSGTNVPYSQPRP